jgi:hypothetical protein
VSDEEDRDRHAAISRASDHLRASRFGYEAHCISSVRQRDVGAMHERASASSNAALTPPTRADRRVDATRAASTRARVREIFRSDFTREGRGDEVVQVAGFCYVGAVLVKLGRSLGGFAKMNMRSLTVILGALTAFALGACKVTTTTGSTGGSTSATGTGGEAAGVGGSGGGGGAGGAAACDEAYTCAEALDGDPSKLCDGAHGDLYDKYFACTCETGGKCFAACGDNACKDGAKTDDCTKCIQATTTGCSEEQAACANDA